MAGVEVVIILVVVIVLLSVGVFGLGWKLTRANQRKLQLERTLSSGAAAASEAPAKTVADGMTSHQEAAAAEEEQKALNSST